MNSSTQSKKKILMFAHYYLPDVASTGQICADLAEGLADVFDVTVICVVPSYTGKIDKKYKNSRAKSFKEEINDVHIVRVKVPGFDKKSKISRIRNIVAYFLHARKAARELGSFDYVFAISQPPILGGMLGTYAAKIKHAKFVYNIQDVNPEQIMAVGYSKNKPVLNLLMKLDKRSCLKADLIVTVGSDLAENIHNRFKDSTKKPKKVVTINNWIDEKQIYPLPSDDEGVIAFKQQYGLTNKFVFMYSGNIGLYYDLEGLFRTIESIKPDTKTADGREVVFAFVGEGTLLDKLKAYKEEHKMDNVIFIPYQKKDKLIYSLNAADVHFCLSAKGIKGVSCPSKYYGIAACKKPVIAVLERGSEIYMILKENNGGLVSEPTDYEKLVANIKTCIDGNLDLAEMADFGYKFWISKFTKVSAIESYKFSLMLLETKKYE